MRAPRLKALMGEGKRSFAGYRLIHSLLRYADLGRRFIRRNAELLAAPRNSVGVRGLNSFHLDTIPCLVEWLVGRRFGRYDLYYENERLRKVHLRRLHEGLDRLSQHHC